MTQGRDPPDILTNNQYPLDTGLLNYIRTVIKCPHPKLMLRVYRAVTHTYRHPDLISKEAGEYENRVIKYLLWLTDLGYLDKARRRNKNRPSKSRKVPYAFKKNGRNLIKEEYDVWKNNLANLNQKFGNIDKNTS